MLKTVLVVIVLPHLVTSSDVRIDTDRTVAEVQPYFISYAMDAYLLAESPRWLKFDFGSTKLRTLMSGLAPALLRFGGSPADWTIFTDDITAQNHLNASGAQPVPSVFTHSDLDNMVNLTKTTGNRFLFDLDLQLRFGTQWDPTNAMYMMEYMQNKNYGDNIDFELGNEPDEYHRNGQAQISAEQVGKDFISLIHLVHSFPNLKQSNVVGPDVVGKIPGSKGREIFKSVVEQAGAELTASTFHHYYFRGDTAHVKDYINPSHFSNLKEQIELVKKTINETSHPHTPVWIGETADAWHSGTENVSDRFVSGFLWLEKLGLSAREGVGVVVRQTLYGHNYGLLDINMDPNPDYWLSWMHKCFVGTSVLNVTSLYMPNTTRVYAHCTPSNRSYPEGSITVFALNVSPNVTDTIHVISDTGDSQKVYSYLMTAPGNDLISKFVAVNGEVLKMVDDRTLPKVKAKTIDLANGITLPPLSFGFFVLPNAKAKACM